MELVPLNPLYTETRSNVRWGSFFLLSVYCHIQ